MKLETKETIKKVARLSSPLFVVGAMALITYAIVTGVEPPPKPEPPAQPFVGLATGVITVESTPEEFQFKRVYKGTFELDGFHYTVEISRYNTSYSHERKDYLSKLEQFEDGSYILFDSNQPARRIIQPKLLEAVQPFIKAALDADDLYVARGMKEVFGPGGHVWTRQD